jgi:hypothetical protein
MKYKDTVSLQDAYQLIFEGKAPCPCTVGKHCKNDECDCKVCKKDKQKMMKEGASVEDRDSESLSDPQMQEAMAILQQYAQKDITNLEAAKMFKDLFEKGAGQGPTQDDMYKTTTNNSFRPENRPMASRFKGMH